MSDSRGFVPVSDTAGWVTVLLNWGVQTVGVDSFQTCRSRTSVPEGRVKGLTAQEVSPLTASPPPPSESTPSPSVSLLLSDSFWGPFTRPTSSLPHPIDAHTPALSKWPLNLKEQHGSINLSIDFKSLKLTCESESQTVQQLDPCLLFLQGCPRLPLFFSFIRGGQLICSGAFCCFDVSPFTLFICLLVWWPTESRKPSLAWQEFRAPEFQKQQVVITSQQVNTNSMLGRVRVGGNMRALGGRMQGRV